MLDGSEVTSLMGIHQQCRVLIVSDIRKFKGLKNFDKFGTDVRPSLPVDKVRPKPSAWLKAATSNWFRTNEAVELPNEGLHFS